MQNRKYLFSETEHWLMFLLVTAHQCSEDLLFYPGVQVTQHSLEYL